MRVLAAFVLVLWLASAGSANDSAVVGKGGRVHRLRGEQTTVRMVRESVRMDVYPSRYTVQATFLFRNDGPATTVTMGFPESGGGDIGARRYRRTTGFISFATWVDGRRVPARREAAAGGDDVDYRAYWVKRVRFGKAQTRTVRVRYKSTVGRDTTGARWATYGFTGGNWRGTVDESLLQVVPHLPGTSLVTFSLGGKRLPATNFRLRKTHWQAEGVAEFSFHRTLPGYLFVDGLGENGGRPPSPDALSQPGRAESVDWAPPGLQRNGVVFLRANALRVLLDRRSATDPRSQGSALSWNEKSKEATLEGEGHTFDFAVGRRSLLVDGSTRVPLPAAPFVSPPLDRSPAGALYVPLEPVLKVVGGTYRINKSERQLHVTIPKPKPNAARPGVSGPYT